MLTGDQQATADQIAQQVGITDVHAGCLPIDKIHLLEQTAPDNRPIVMVGDGVNDAPSLAQADVGIAMGGGGSDVAIETADVTLMNDAIGTIPYLLDVGQRTFRVVRQHVYGFLIVKGLILVLGIAGTIGLSVAVAADAIMAILVVLNGLRIYSVGNKATVIIDK